MLTTAAILLALAALGGATLATLHVRKGTAPLALAGLHGIVAGTGLLVFAWHAIRYGSAGMAGTAGLSLGCFILAVPIGFTMLGFHLRKRRLPRILIAVHATLALTGYVLLLVTLMNAPDAVP